MTEPKPLTTREEAARAELGRTAISGPAKGVLLAGFLAVIFAVPAAQMAGTAADYGAGRRDSPVPQPLEILASLPSAVRAGARAEGSVLDRVFAANRSLLADINRYEDDLEEGAYAGRWARPPLQYLMAWWLGAGNEKAYVGRGGWLFYRPDVDYVTGPGFLDARRLARRAAEGSETAAPPQPDPRRAIVEFHEHLRARGITLVLMPTPVKPSIHPEQFSRRFADRAQPVQNRSYGRLLGELQEAGVLVFDPAPALVRAKRGRASPQYLAADTHWRPEAMERVAADLKEFIESRIPLPPARPARLKRQAVSQTAPGDTALLLDLPEDQAAWPPETVEVQTVTGLLGELWRADPSADVLVLGDSFANVFSLGAMGWGESAGLVEQLSFLMQRPMDRIIRNDDGAFATREILSRELGRGRDRLAGKRAVVWQFADRELALGNWKLLPMDLGTAPAEQFLVPEPGQEMVVTGTIAAISGVPRPGSVTYRDHILSAHLVDLETEKGPMEGGQALVYLWSMRDAKWTDAARRRPGDVVTVRLRPWEDVVEEYGTINRSLLDDPGVRLQAANWGEMVETRRAAAERAARFWPVYALAAALLLCAGLRAYDWAARR